MQSHPHPHDRRSIRIPNFDYSQPGYYYVTVCTQDRKYLFGEVKNFEMHRSPAGQMVHDEILSIPKYRDSVVVDEFIVMPDHFHAIFQLTEFDVNFTALVGTLKSSSARRVRKSLGIDGLWQRNYWEQVLRTAKSLQNRRQYIRDNPINWELESQMNEEFHR